MENQENSNKNHNFHHSRNKFYNRSMSDTDSQTSPVESFHSPLRFDSPLRSDDPFPPPDKSPPKSTSKAIVSVDKDKYFSPLRSPPPPNLYKATQNFNVPPPVKSPSPLSMYNRSVREEPAVGVTKVGPGGVVGAEEDGDVGGERRSRAAVASILRRPRRDVAVERAALGFRVLELVVSLISFSVMASDKTQGWSGDSFDRYREYRYCLSVNVIAFVYSGFQALDLTYRMISGGHGTASHLRYQFDFLMDQILAYLLISASSSAATRVDDWVSNWGKDEFTEKASASIGMSFLAFLAFAISSLISGYNLCHHSTV